MVYLVCLFHLPKISQVKEGITTSRSNEPNHLGWLDQEGHAIIEQFDAHYFFIALGKKFLSNCGEWKTVSLPMKESLLLINGLSECERWSWEMLSLLLFLEGCLQIWGKSNLKLYYFCFCFDVRIFSTNFHQCLSVLLELTSKHFETWLVERTSYGNAKGNLWWRTYVSPRFD